MILFISEYVNPAAYEDESLPEPQRDTVTVLNVTTDSHSDDSDIPEISAGKEGNITHAGNVSFYDNNNNFANTHYLNMEECILFHSHFKAPHKLFIHVLKSKIWLISQMVLSSSTHSCFYGINNKKDHYGINRIVVRFTSTV